MILGAINKIYFFFEVHGPGAEAAFHNWFPEGPHQPGTSGYPDSGWHEERWGNQGGWPLS
jgi:hypothetical protein